MGTNGGVFPDARVLIVDDEPNIASLMMATLSGADIAASCAISGRDALRVLEKSHFDAIVLDITLPDMTGFELLQEFRGRGFTQPVLFVTARDATTDRVDGLSLGAEDYIVKPFDVDEFVARVQVCLRRLTKFAPQQNIRVGNVNIDLNTRTVTRSGVNIMLTPTEFSILACLARNKGKAVSRQEILNEVWFEGFKGQSALLDPYVSHLRKKMDDETPHLIHTVRGLGYMIRPEK